MNGVRSLTELVHTRLTHIEDIIKEQDYGPIYYLLQKLFSKFARPQHFGPGSASQQQKQRQQQLLCELLELIVESHGSTTVLCCWISQELQVEITEGEAHLLRQYVKICSRQRSFSYREDYEILIPPHISDYSSWCKRLRYLRSLPPPLRKEKYSQSVTNTPHHSRPSSPLRTPRLPSIKRLPRQRSLPSLHAASAAPPSRVAVTATAPSLPPVVPRPPPPVNQELRFPAIVRLVAAENKKIRQEVFHVLGVN
jgi:hypothetical protein